MRNTRAIIMMAVAVLLAFAAVIVAARWIGAQAQGNSGQIAVALVDIGLGARINSAVATLLDEDRSDWYAAALRAAAGETPPSAGPDVARWRRVWESSASPTSRHRRVKAWRT